MPLVFLGTNLILDLGTNSDHLLINLHDAFGIVSTFSAAVHSADTEYDTYYGDSAEGRAPHMPGYVTTLSRELFSAARGRLMGQRLWAKTISNPWPSVCPSAYQR